MAADEISDLAYIDIRSDTRPVSLFQEWLEEVKPFVLSPNLFNLATVNENGGVSNRNVLLMDVIDDAFYFTTCQTGRKYKQIETNKKVAACFVWIYKEDGKTISKQVRIEGVAEEISRELVQKFYDKDPLYAKIRSHVFFQDRPVDWNELKERHDKFCENIKQTKVIPPVSDHTVGFKIIPSMMDFYYAYDTYIADRLTFKKNDVDDKWSVQRVEA